VTDGFGDARLEELKLLAQLDRRTGITMQPKEGPERDMVFFLVYERFADAFKLTWSEPGPFTISGLPGESPVERHLHDCWVKSLSEALEGRSSVHLELTHKGRVRLSELKQALTTGKIRDQSGILWDGRHLGTDLQIAILDADRNTPLSIGYLDMNGLKQINDSLGHDAGSMAIRVYFQAVSTALADRGQAYRVGGDEVVAILPSANAESAKELFGNVCRLVMGEEMLFAGQRIPPVSISVGLATTVEPAKKFAELRGEADRAMYRAKEKAHQSQPSSSAISELQGEIFVIPFEEPKT
jgi:diguanylate cyclase (GGDEF)-like protein